MKKIFQYLAIPILITAHILFTGYGAGPATVISQSMTGAPGENGLMCSNCHGSPGSYGGVNTTVEVFHPGTSSPVLNYTSATTYDVQVTVNHNANTPIGFGFQCVAVDAQGAQVGTFSNPASNTKIVTLPNGVMVAEQDGLSVLGQAHVFNFQWTSPTFLQSVDVTFYSTGVAANSNSANTGDSGSETSGTITLSSTPAPVELIDFTASNIDNRYHLLQWSTASEQDADYFIVEHSNNQEAFKPIAQINAAGNTLEQQDYEFRNTQPYNDINYYRLIQVDLDGTRHTQKTVSVYQFDALELVKIYPIPAINNATLEIRYNDQSTFNLKILDDSGKTVKQNVIELAPGINTLTLDISNLAAGAYFLHLTNNKTQINTPLLKF